MLGQRALSTQGRAHEPVRSASSEHSERERGGTLGKGDWGVPDSPHGVVQGTPSLLTGFWVMAQSPPDAWDLLKGLSFLLHESLLTAPESRLVKGPLGSPWLGPDWGPCDREQALARGSEHSAESPALQGQGLSSPAWPRV